MTNLSFNHLKRAPAVYQTGFDLFFMMFDFWKKSDWSGYFVWHVIINNPAASKDLIEG